MRGACASRLGTDVVLDEEALAYARLGVYCGTETATPEAAFACQSSALSCTADASVGTLAPRAAELLRRAGVDLPGDPRCLAAAHCGDGELDDDEECDDGAVNSDTRPDVCRTTCLDPACGDGVVDGDEDCDDGNVADGDGCDTDCFAEDGTCGDGAVADDEECDDGNRRARDGCDAECLLEPGVCGDAVVTDDEECDAGTANSDTLPDRCRRDCTEPTCGDGVVDDGNEESCEPPGTLLCDDDCTLRLPLFVATRRTTGAAACQTALLRAGLRIASRTSAVVGRCVQGLARCALGVGDESAAYDRCVARAERFCAVAAGRRDAGVVHHARSAADRCASLSLADALDDGGLGFAVIAGSCPAGPDTPGIADLVACVADRARCFGERAVAESVPRAHELLLELEDDPEERFPCVVDPDELGSPGGAFVDGV